LVVLASLVGGYVPFLGRITHDRLQFYLSLSAGVMLGASFFHVMPDAMETAGKAFFGWWMALGVVGLFCIERFIAPHSHEVSDGGHHHHHNHGEGHHHHEQAERSAEWDRKQAVVLASVLEKDRRAAAPAVAGWMAVLGLTIHTFMNGVGLAGAVQHEAAEAHQAALNAGLMTLPGLAMFLAIVFHKPADALAISTVLTRKGVSYSLVRLVQFGFALMVPVGALAFFFAQGVISEHLKDQLIGAALSFSAGTFLFIALSDLLPEVQFHRHDRVQLFLALVAGVALMGGIAILEDLGKEEAAPAAAAAVNPGK
jgi:zinc and cadmium transporter